MAPARPPAGRPVLRVQGLHFAHAGQAPLFSGWQASLPAGVVWLCGDTGSGKTTLLRLLAGELPPQAGHLTLGGRDAAAQPAAWRRQVCWFDPRDPAWDGLTPAGLLAAQAARHPGQHLPGRRHTWQQQVLGLGLAPHLDKPLYALSTGSRRKAALAVALSSTAPLILLDEPTAGLDGASLRHLAGALAARHAARGSVLVLACSAGPEAVPGAPAGQEIALGSRTDPG